MSSNLHPADVAATPVAGSSDQLFTVPDQDDPIRDHLAGEGTPVVAQRAVDPPATHVLLWEASGVVGT